MASRSPTVNKIEKAHQMYRDGKYTEALGYYTDALYMAKAKPQKIALHSNRAACYLKLHDFKKAAEECTSVLELDQNHTGALMLRAQTLVTLKEYHSAIFDVNRLIELNPSSEVYRNLQARLKTQMVSTPFSLIMRYFNNFIPTPLQHFTRHGFTLAVPSYTAMEIMNLLFSFFWTSFGQFWCFVQGKSLAPIPEDEAELEEDDQSASDETELEAKEDEREGIKEVEEFKNKEDMIDAAAENEKRNDITELGASRNHNIKKKSNKQSGWQAIPKPKGHSNLDYSRWDTVEDDSTEEEDEDEDEDSQPQYRFRVKTVGVKAVK